MTEMPLLFDPPHRPIILSFALGWVGAIALAELAQWAGYDLSAGLVIGIPIAATFIGFEISRGRRST